MKLFILRDKGDTRAIPANDTITSIIGEFVWKQTPGVVAASTSKKIVAVRFDREPVAGFVNPQTYLQPAGIEVLTPAGTVAVLPYDEVKAICFVRDSGSTAVWRPNVAFTARPKKEGLWVRFHFKDGDTIEGLLPGNLVALDPAGFTIAPPETGGTSAARVFIPRSAVRETQILGVIGVAARRARKPKTREGQLEMFE
jgi:hypothetical protein